MIILHTKDVERVRFQGSRSTLKIVHPFMFRIRFNLSPELNWETPVQETITGEFQQSDI